MPWNLLTRIVMMVVVRRFFSRMRAARGVPFAAQRPLDLLAKLALDRWLSSAAYTARMTVHAVTLVIFLVACGAALIAGTTAFLLAPKWLGVAILVLAAGFLLGVILEARALLHDVGAVRARRHAQALRREL